MQCDALPDRLAQVRGRYLLARAAKLDLGIVRGTVMPHDDGEPRHAFASDERYFHRPSNAPVGDNGGKVALEEIDMIDPFVRRLELLRHVQPDLCKVFLQQAEVSGQKARKDLTSRVSLHGRFQHRHSDFGGEP